MFKIVQYGLAIVLGISFHVFQPASEVVNSICLILILAFGIPHGGVDHLIHTSTSSDTNVLKYVFKYLMLSAGFILWWIIDPSKALLIFIILSAYHFGQEFVADAGIKGQNVPINLIWGSVILISPMIYNYQEVVGYLQVIIPDLPVMINPIIGYAMTAMSIALAIVSIIYIKKSQNIPVKKVLKMISFLVMIIVSQALLPFLQAFTLYFVLFHSLNAFSHQFLWLKNKRRNYNLGKFITDLIGFSALAVLGILGLLWFLQPESHATLITYFFILTSLITLPHAITLDQFYRFKNKATESIT